MQFGLKSFRSQRFHSEKRAVMFLFPLLFVDERLPHWFTSGAVCSQRALPSAGGWAAAGLVVCRPTGVEPSRAADSVRVGCRATAWTHTTTVTVMQTAWTGTGIFFHPISSSENCLYVKC